MKTFTINFHAEDAVDVMTVQKLSQEDFNKVTESGTRHLFDLDTNIGYFVFFDAIDHDENVRYLLLQYEEDHEEPAGCYGFELEDFYGFLALYISDFNVEENEEDEEEYGPIHHLAHLLHHVIEEGSSIEV